MFRGQITFFPVVFGVKPPFPYVFCMFLYVFVVVDADFPRRWSLFLAICVRVFADAGEPKKGGKKLRWYFTQMAIY